MFDPIYDMTTTAALESDLQEIAMESLDSETTVIGNYFNQSSKYLVKDYDEALKNGDIPKAIKALDEIEKLAKRCKADLDRVPIESRTHRHLVALAKLTAFVVGTIMLLNIGDVAGKTASLLKASMGNVEDAALKAAIDKTIQKGTVDRMVSGTITKQGIKLHAKSQISFGAIAKSLVNPITDETKQKYADDPHAVSRTYLRMQQTLDKSLVQLREARAVLKAAEQDPEKFVN